MRPAVAGPVPARSAVPLDFPALVTIHDLPPDAREMATVKVVDGKERGVKYRFFEVKPPLQPKDLPDDQTG